MSTTDNVIQSLIQLICKEWVKKVLRFAYRVGKEIMILKNGENIQFAKIKVAPIFLDAKHRSGPMKKIEKIE